MRSLIRSAALAGFAFLAAAGQPAQAAGFENIILSASEDGEQNETTFAPDTPKIFLSADLTDEVEAGSKITVTWISVDSGGAAPANYRIDEVSFNVGMMDNRLDSSLSKPNAGWPVGTYQVQITVDGKVEETVDFEVR